MSRAHHPLRAVRLAVLLCALAIGAAPAARGADGGATEASTARATLDVAPVSARVGDPLTAKLMLEAPTGNTFEPPALEASFGTLAVLSGSWSGPEVQGAVTRWTWTGVLAAYETGELTVPAIALAVRGPAGAGTARTEALTVSIESVLPPTEAGGADTGSAEIADLKPPASIAPDYSRLRAALAIVAGLLALAAVAWWLNRRYAGRLAAVPAPEDPFRRIPPHQWAYEELQRLLEKRLPESGETEQFFAELSWILKRYLSGRYRVNLMEHTTEEVVPLLRQAGAPAAPVGEARALLARCDLVKFAKQPADTEACRLALEEAYRVVDRTKPADAQLPAQAPAAGAA